METCSIIRHRGLLRSSAFFLVACLVLTAGQSNPSAQTPEAAKTSEQKTDKDKGSSTAATQPEDVSADHFDPDDQKTYEDVVTEDRAAMIRGQRFILHLYRSKASGAATPAIYACGDGGWRGLAPRTAQQLAHMGFAVAGVDSKVYLRQLSSVQDPVTIKQLAQDYVAIAQVTRDYAAVEKTTPVYIYGWSVGAGFAVAVGSDAESRSNWAGIISIGLPSQNQLVSGVGGNSVDLNTARNARFGFRTDSVMGTIAPLPLVMIQSTSDTASPQRVGKVLFAAARYPKQYVLINASNHRFSGARDEFYAALDGAGNWIRRVRGSSEAGAQTAGGQTTANSLKGQH